MADPRVRDLDVDILRPDGPSVDLVMNHSPTLVLRRQAIAWDEFFALAPTAWGRCFALGRHFE